MPRLRADLLAVQARLRQASFPVIVVFARVDGAGKGDTVNLLNEWMDPRWLVTRAFGPPSEEERERPEYWRYWLNLPPRGRVGIYLSSWYSEPILDRVYGRAGAATFTGRLSRIVDFERTLADDGALILKFWMHLDKAGHRRRLEKLEKNRLTHWRVTKREWTHWRLYDRFVDGAEVAIRHTSRGNAPWVIVEGADANYRSLTVATAVRDAIKQRLGEVAAEASKPAPPTLGAPEQRPTRRRPVLALEREVMVPHDGVVGHPIVSREPGRHELCLLVEPDVRELMKAMGGIVAVHHVAGVEGIRRECTRRE